MAQFKIISGPGAGQVGEACGHSKRRRNPRDEFGPYGRELTMADGSKRWVHTENLSMMWSAA